MQANRSPAAGGGPHAVFLHSTGMGPFMWRPFAEHLPESWVLHTPVHIGYPPGPLLPRGHAASLQDDVEAVLQQLPTGVDELHLGAHSYGALVALKLALSGRAPVTSLWLYEPVMYGALRLQPSQPNADVAAEIERLYSHPAYQTIDAEEGGNDAWLQGFIEHWNGPGAWAAMPEGLKAKTRAVGWKMYMEVRNQAADTARFEDHRVGLPLTIVVGEHTTAAARAMAESLARANPGARLEVLAGQGHMAPATAFTSVAPSILRHLAWATGEAA
ncbi:alpha/beta hydrolase [Ideonella sp. DXS29W]|uniref:Alpha/beta hydrolase n=1 Tax=Ideonella lacteola TaxID=2984193 RepID=A0ABU9BM13_9BURK